jgi:ABC-2 type transport system ATP-binding protein
MAILIEEVTKRYRGASRDSLHDVSLTCNHGVFGLLGPNGAGKTTLLRILVGLISPTSGRAMVQGYNVLDQPDQVRSCIGYAPQEYSLYPHLTVLEFLEYMGMLSGVNHLRQRIDQTLAQVGLLPVVRRRINTLSGGMKQRVVIAQALLHEPQVLLVDEPTSGLDPTERVRFRNLLVELGREKTVLLSSHIVEDISAACNQLVVLHQGEVAFYGDVGALISLAQGKALEAQIPSNEWDRFQESNFLISSRPATQMGFIQARFLASASQPSNATSVDATIEDAYLLLVSGRNTQ